MSAEITYYPRSAYKVMPWKNGAGSTTELLIFPQGASVQSGFEWRISLAQVPASGPFSAFPGYHRTIMLLRGDSMQLVHEGHGRHTLQALQPYSFHGSWNTEGILSGGPVEDFNVMIREECGQAHVLVHRGKKGSAFQTNGEPVQFIWCWSGTVTIEVEGQMHHLSEQDSLLITGGPASTVLVDSALGLIISVGLRNRPS